MKKATLRDISQKAGVSVTAVSLALRGSNRISPEKTDEIVRIAEELDYRRDPVMNALNSYRGRRESEKKRATIVFVQGGEQSLPIESQGKTANAYWKGAVAESEPLGYKLENIWMGDPNLDVQEINRSWRTQGVVGLIVYQPYNPLEKITSILDDYSTVWLGDGPKDMSLHCVRTNRFSSMNLAWSELMQLGYRKGGLVLHPHKPSYNYAEWEAAHHHYHQRFLPEEQYIPPFTFNPSEGCDLVSFKSWLDTWKPEVVLTTISQVYEMLKALNYAVPKDIGFLHLATEQGSNWSGVDQESYSVAQVAMRLLDQLICSRELGVPEHQQVIEMNGVWHAGRTLRKIGPDLGV